MATITPPNYVDMAGVPSQSSDTIALVPEGLVTGDHPSITTEDMTVAASQTIPARTLVGLNGAGNIIPAVLGTTAAIGFCQIDIVTDASATLKAYPITRSGVFNPDMLKYDATYDTDEKKHEAFRAAPSPTQIIIRRPKTGTVVLP